MAYLRPDVDSDGLPVNEAGFWTAKKHKLLHDYVVASRGARRRFEGNSSFIDLFSGPGRTWIQDKGPIVDGSPLVAFRAAQKSGNQFGTYYFADAERDNVAAAAQRVERLGGRVRSFTGPAAETVKLVARELRPTGLHFAFLDPYNLTHLPFSVLSELSRFKHMDMLIHVSVMHLKRELLNWLDRGDHRVLDDFMPGWKDHVNVHQSQQKKIRIELFQYWKSLIVGLNMTAAENVRSVENSRGAEIYWLVLVTRHPLAEKLWSSIATASRQRNLF